MYVCVCVCTCACIKILYKLFSWILGDLSTMWEVAASDFPSCENSLYIHGTYRIAGNFRGVKISWFSWLSSEPRNIYPRMIS